MASTDTSTAGTGPPRSTPGWEAAERADDAVLDEWARLKVVDTSPRAQRIRAQVEEIRRRRRPAADANPYTGTIDLDDLGLDRSRTYADLSASYRHTAEMFDDLHRETSRKQAADDALFWHAAADAFDEQGSRYAPDARPLPSRTANIDPETALRQRRSDDIVLVQAGELSEDDDSDTAQQLRLDAEQITRQRRERHAEAVAAGIPPCPAAWSRTTPCVHPDGDGHDGFCFPADDAGGWPRAVSWFTPESAPQPADGAPPQGAAANPAGSVVDPAHPLGSGIGEVTGLVSATRYARGMIDTLAGQAQAVDTFVAALRGAGASGEAVNAGLRAQEYTTTAAGAWAAAHSALDRHNVVRDAYAAAPGAGARTFVTG